ncbi:MAG: hypothetical protein JO016_00525 [Actinobacteria bacterium]|nr:hypothetical protein [Actinomycetota bacterium]
MRATLNRFFPKTLTAVFGSLAALTVTLTATGCGTTASAAATVAGPTQASAQKVFSAYVTAQRVAVVNHDALLASSLTSSSQYSLVSTQWSANQTVIAPSYGKPTFYVPKLITYPQWFMAVVPEYDHGRSLGTYLMVFDKPEASAPWALDGSVQLARDAPALNIAVKDGYATALRTTDTNLLFRPDEVGALHASVVDEGPTSPAAKVVEAGPLTTGLYQSYTAKQKQAPDYFFSWELEGTSYPFFALATNDGGAIVMYTMSLNTATSPKKASTQPIPIPDGLQSLVLAGKPPITHVLDIDSTLQYVAVDPPPAKKGGTTGKLQVVGSSGFPTYVGGK